jgi:MFS family permease
MLFKFSAYGFLKNLRFFEPLFLLFFTVAKGLSYTQFGILIGIREVFVYVLEIPTGIVADVTGRRRAMMMAFGSYLCSFAVFSLASSFWAFVPAMVLFAAGEAFRSGTHKSMIMQHLDLEGLSDQKVHYYGFTRSMSRLGSAASALALIVFALVGGSYAVIFPATMVPYALGLLLMFTYPPELDGETRKKALLPSMWRHTVQSARSLWGTHELGKVVINESEFESFFRVAKDYLQPIVKTAALSLPVLAALGEEQTRTFALMGTVAFCVHMNSFASSRLSGRLADRAGHLGRMLNGLFWIFAAAFCLAGLFYGMNLVLPAIVVLFFFYTLYNLRKPVVVGFLSERIPGQQRATLLSVQNQLRAICAAVVAPLFGWVADNVGAVRQVGISRAFLLGGLVLLALGLVLRLEAHPTAPPEQ